MDHAEAKENYAVERYQLDEMTPDERKAFELHYFECEECWKDVHRADVFAQNARLVRFDQKPEAGDNVRPFRPKPMMRWMSSAAAAALLVMSIGTFTMWWNGPRDRTMAYAYVPSPVRNMENPEPVELNSNEWTSLNVQIPPNVNEAVSYRLEVRGNGEIESDDVSLEETKKGSVSWSLRPLPPGTYELLILSVDKGGSRSVIYRKPVQVGGGS